LPILLVLRALKLESLSIVTMRYFKWVRHFKCHHIIRKTKNLVTLKPRLQFLAVVDRAL